MQEQECRKCHTIKSVEMYSRDSHIKSGVSTVCKQCQSESWAVKPGRVRKGPRKYVEPVDKWCNGCQQTLPINRFNKRSDRKNGYLSRCRDCVGRAHDEWRTKNPDASRLRNLLSKYKITGAQYFQMLEDQSGGCAVCGQSDSGWKTSPFMHVDHCHETGRVRALLCHRCNVAVGTIENGTPIEALRQYMEAASLRG